MVRKWSYISPIKSCLSRRSTSFRYLRRVHVIKVFRSGTRFLKRYIRRQTRFTRLTYRRRKHKTSWLSFSYLIFSWVKNFLKYRQYLRFYQSLGLLKFQSYSTTSSLIHNVIGRELLSYSVSTFSCSRKLINVFNSFSTKDKPVLLPPISGVLFTGLLSVSPDQLQLEEDLNPGLVECEGFRYPFSTNVKYFSDGIHMLTYLGTSNTVFNVVLSYTMVIYILSLLLVLKTIRTIK